MACIETIQDIHIAELAPFSDLKESQLFHYNEPDEGLFVAETLLVIERALTAGYEPISFLIEDKMLASDSELKDILDKYPEVVAYTAEKSVLNQITGYALTRGILCLMKRKAMPTAEEVCCGAKRVAVLDHVENPANVGAIFRSAAALHMDAVLVTADSSDPLYRRAIRVGMGTVFQIPWTYLKKGETSVSQLHGLGFRTVAMALREDSCALDDPILLQPEKLAIILGSEGTGLPDATIEESDFTVMIPMSHGVDSLNVAAASAVAFWQLSRTETIITGTK